MGIITILSGIVDILSGIVDILCGIITIFSGIIAFLSGIITTFSGIINTLKLYVLQQLNCLVLCELAQDFTNMHHFKVICVTMVKLFGSLRIGSRFHRYAPF